jgi:hypothetical protein
VRAIHIDTDPIDSKLLVERWEHWGGGISLLVLESPYRSLVGPLLHYIDIEKAARPDGMITVVIPEFVTGRWWHGLLHNQSGLLLKIALLSKEGVTTTNMRFHVRGQRIKEACGETQPCSPAQISGGENPCRDAS